MKVLVTGGAGYIGSTICSALIDNGHEPIILDSLVTGREEFTKGKIFYKGDIADKNLLEKIFTDHPGIQYTIHCAALIVVPESVESPYEYYRENVGKSLELFHTLNRLGCKNVVFSSSASIYDDVANFMVTEEAPLNARSPYARTKYMMEMVLKDFCFAYGMRGIALRYFNPIGADPKMRSGVHVQFPSHVLGKLVDVALGNDPVFKITGVNWDTRDGSGIRDFVHVWDLALAHVKAVERFEEAFKDSAAIDNYLVINLGSGDGITVKELVKAFENVYGKEINKEEAMPRPGDVPGSYANTDRAKRLLGWQAQMSIEQGIADALKWGEIRETIIKY
ncbi:UDP-glucose 4-epimerase GalE [Clostridium sp. YIM B02505]|uniref:UDP-glucose 4-epimerase n=1 Tax=Clostridium yunnanense TaxID=2800325 RepID=A0ABS1ESZ7_9CLOT|nr:UDP-glucose 4-epimerase GalE [Clostridium yunnanense]MBK1812521.1 UDP-glucose 4-epimerase GalE [Clostridium yunnanense]